MNYDSVKNDFSALCNAILSTAEVVDTEKSHKIEVDCNGVKVSRSWLNKETKPSWDSVKINGQTMCKATDDEKATVQLFAENMDWSKVRYENDRPYFMSLSWTSDDKPERVKLSAPTSSPLSRMCATILKYGSDDQKEALKTLIEPWAAAIEEEQRQAELKAALVAVVARYEVDKKKGTATLKVHPSEADKFGRMLVDLEKPLEGVKKYRVLVDVVGATTTTKELVKANAEFDWDF